MTRINCVPAAELTRQHLLAEWRELPRVYTLAEQAWRRDPRLDYPQTYRLGAGHVKFFYTRLGYLDRRFRELHAEMQARGYATSWDCPPVANVPPSWYRGWEPDDAALALNRARIAERLTVKGVR